MTVTRDRVVIAQRETRRPGEPEQRVDLELCVERVRGIEPPLRAWEARVLPLNYTRGSGHLMGPLLASAIGAGAL